MSNEELGSEIMTEDSEHEEKIAQFVRNRLLKMGIEIKNCRSCGKEIVFMKTNRGKIMPISLNLITHFYDCPQAQEFRRDYSEEDAQPDYRRGGNNGEYPHYGKQMRRY
ncbi:MAG: hypothetical protein WA057_01615 [Candidatus Magasanikiibacteriota bacterium]